MKERLAHPDRLSRVQVLISLIVALECGHTLGAARRALWTNVHHPSRNVVVPARFLGRSGASPHQNGLARFEAANVATFGKPLRSRSLFTVVGHHAICRLDGVHVMLIGRSTIKRIALRAGLTLVPGDLERTIK
jgi:hypothetical protein